MHYQIAIVRPSRNRDAGPQSKFLFALVKRVRPRSSIKAVSPFIISYIAHILSVTHSNYQIVIIHIGHNLDMRDSRAKFCQRVLARVASN